MLKFILPTYIYHDTGNGKHVEIALLSYVSDSVHTHMKSLTS